MKMYIKSSLSEQQMYGRWNVEQDLYETYKNKPDMSLKQIWNEIARKYSSDTADGVCWMLDVYDERK